MQPCPTRIEIIQGDITKLNVDAIVNAANNQLLPGGGVCGAIHQGGGPVIAEECAKVGGCDTGDAKITSAGNLPAQYVIHAVGPMYNDGLDGEAELLTRTYLHSLKIAEKYNLNSISFPAISCGIYGYPIQLAAPLALKTVSHYLHENPGLSKVIFALYSPSDFAVYQQAFNNMNELELDR